MKKEQPFIARSSIVPILACVALMLFGANFYQFLRKNVFSHFGWDVRCPIEVTDHHRHRHQHKIKHPRAIHLRATQSGQDQHTIIFEFDREGRELNQAERALERAERSLKRNLERAVRDLARLHERVEYDPASQNRFQQRVERLEVEIEAKARSLERLQQRLEIRVERKIQVRRELQHRLRFRQGTVDVHIHR